MMADFSSANRFQNDLPYGSRGQDHDCSRKHAGRKRTGAEPSELYAAEGSGKLISRGNQNGRVATVLESTDAAPLGAPNDIIFDSRGGFYFTDPGTAPLRPLDPNRHGKVYYVASNGGREPLLVDDKIAFPNGLTITPDGKALLVDDTLGDTIWAIDLAPKAKNKGKGIHEDCLRQNSGADGWHQRGGRDGGRPRRAGLC